MCVYFIRFIDFMLPGKNVTDFINLFSPINLKKNDDIISYHYPEDFDYIYCSNFYHYF